MLQTYLEALHRIFTGPLAAPMIFLMVLAVCSIAGRVAEIIIGRVKRHG